MQFVRGGYEKNRKSQIKKNPHRPPALASREGPPPLLGETLEMLSSIKN